MAEPSPSRHLLIPFAGRSSPACLAAVAGLRLPHLDALLARLSLAYDDTQAATTLSPPHERALARSLGIEAHDGLVPWAAAEAQRNGLTRAGAAEPWGLVTLCHWEVAIDEVLLEDPADIGIDEAESQALLEAARPLFQSEGIALRGSAVPGRWLARGELFRTLPTASLDRVAGRPISEWAPLSDALRPVRKLQNEMQMLLYTQRVNDERALRGARAVNAFWLSGTGALPKSALVTEVPAPNVIDTLRAPALADDAAGWAAAWQALDAGPIAALRAEEARGAAVALTLCGDRAARRFVPQRRGAATFLRGLLRRPQAATVLRDL
jgi:hypothetical protein